MQKYRFRLIETYSKEFEIEAESRDEAVEILDNEVSEGNLDATVDDADYCREIYDA